jgi:tRNA pseudouridine55 synthase
MEGILIIDKPEGWTSHDVVARVRRLTKVKRVGHTGTLDPFATGLLVVLVGQPTRLAQFLAGAVKEYEARVRFGFATDTGDATGKPLDNARSQVAGVNSVCQWSASEVEAALARLRGEIEQVPPMYSAKKIEGRKLYELARRGIEVERSAVRVHIYELEAVRPKDALLEHNEDGTCDLQVRVVCSAGTYIRTLSEEIGKLLGAPAHLVSLRRTRAGDFKIEQAIGLDDLKEKAEASRKDLAELFLPPDAALSGLPFVHLRTDEAQKTLHGVALQIEDGKVGLETGVPVRMLDEDGRLIAVGFYEAASRSLRPRVVFSPEK